MKMSLWDLVKITEVLFSVPLLMSMPLFVVTRSCVLGLYYAPNGRKLTELGREYLNLTDKKRSFSFPVAEHFATVCLNEDNPGHWVVCNSWQH